MTNTPGQTSSSSSPGVHDSKVDGSGSVAANKSLKATRRPVACKKCHALKVKCTPADENDPAGPCIRCVNSNRVCEIDLNATRKRRKKNASEAPPAQEVATPIPAPSSSFTSGPPLTIPSNEPPSNFSMAQSYTDDKSLVERLQEQIRLLTAQLDLAKKDLVMANRTNHNQPYSSIYVCKNDLEREIGILCETSSQVLNEVTTETRLIAERRLQLISKNRSSIDVVSKGIITQEDAQERLDLYRQKIYPRNPYVKISDDMTVTDFRKSEPYLFNVIMAVSSIVYTKPVPLDTSLEIDITAIRLIVEEVLIGGHKKTEYVKSFLLLALWNNSPELFRNRRFHIMNYLSVTLLHDLGIVGKPNFLFMSGSKKFHKSTQAGNEKHLNHSIHSNHSTHSKESSIKDDVTDLNTPYSGTPRENEPVLLAAPETIEQRKIILILFFQTVLICLTLRRSIYVKWTPYVEECCQILEFLENPEDVYIALFSRLSRELERVHHLVHTPEREGSGLAARYVIDEIQKNLEVIKQKIPKNDAQFLSYFYLVEAYLHEPYLANIVTHEVTAGAAIKSDTIVAVSRCTVLCMKALEMFNLLSVDQLATIPLLYISRIIYTAGMLLRLRYLILQLPLHIEKDLVPQRAIYLIQQTSRLVASAQKKYLQNHFLKKTRVILVLFTHTYARQVQDLLMSNGETPDNFKPFMSSDKELLKNEDYWKLNSVGGLLTTELGKAYNSQFLPLEILLHAATSFRDNVSDERQSNMAPPKNTTGLPGPKSPYLPGHPPSNLPNDKNSLRKFGQIGSNSILQDQSYGQGTGSQPSSQMPSPRLPFHTTAPYLDSPLNLMKKKSVLLNSTIPNSINGSIGNRSLFNRGSQPLNNMGSPSMLNGLSVPPDNQSIQGQPIGDQFGIGPNFGNTNDIPTWNTNVANQDQLELLFQVFHDEFWSDILGSNNDKMNFSMNTAPDQYFI